MGTTVVRPRDRELQAAVRLAAAFAAFTFLLHLAINLYEAHIGYGYFRDEMYYVMCGRHLAWDYVDHGPLVAVQARLAETLFGHSLAGLRALSAVGGAGRVLLTGLLCWSLGGTRPAQVLAMLGVSLAPVYLALDSFLSMNSCESLFWMTCLLAIILMERGGSPRLWLLFGLAGGLGLLNKPSMTFFLLALLAGLLLTRQRKLLFSRWTAAGVLLLLVIVLPYLLWQIHFHWPTLEFLRDGQVEHKNKLLAPPAFILTQILNLNPVSILVWAAGLVWLVRRPTWRWLGLTFAIFFVGLMLIHAKDYYVVPVYPILFAAGGIAWAERLARSPGAARQRWFAFPIYETLLIATGLFLLPMSNPVLRPEAWIAYAQATHQYNSSSNSENESSGLLPQFYADRFGWQEEVDTVTKIVASLSPEDRAKVRILCSNYGEASALQFLGHNLPPVISGHNNYWLWGPDGATGEVTIVINGATPAEIKDVYNQVDVAGSMGTKYSMPFEHRNIYIARGRKQNLTGDWAELKNYI